MKLRHIRWFLLGLFVLLLVLVTLSSHRLRTIGLSAQWTGGEYRFAGGTEPDALGFAVLVVAAYLLLMNAERCNEYKPFPGVFRRFIAFWLDFILAMAVTAPILGIIPTLVEWRRTGSFEWLFERETAAKGDMAQLAVVTVLMCLGLFFYYALPLVRRRPSPGACIMGYQVVPDAPTALTLGQALSRTLLGFFAVATAYLAPFIARDRKRGKFWLDRVFNTRAVTLQ